MEPIKNELPHTAHKRRGRYWGYHFHAWLTSINRIRNTPWVSVMTILVIGIALSLPSGLFIFLENIQTLSRGWNDGSRLSLFLQKSVSEEQIMILLKDLKTRKNIDYVNYITPEQGLKTFQKRAGFSDVMKELDNNPLPAVIEITPIAENRTPEQFKTLTTELQSLPIVEFAQLDMVWIERLNGLIQLGQRFISAIACILILGVLIIVGHSIRGTIERSLEEIEVLQMVGASDAYIRRPFLYAGLWYGLWGSVVAWTIVMLGLSWIQSSVHHLAALYGADFHLKGFGILSLTVLLTIGSTVGLAGSWIAVARRLRYPAPL